MGERYPDWAHNPDMNPPEPTELIEFLAPYPHDVQELTLKGREFLYEMLFPVSEIFYDANSAVCAGFLYTDSVRDSFVNFAVYSDHVTLIFQWGVNLDDPQGRLNGAGNQVRHIRLVGMETLKDPYVLGLITQASDRAKRPNGPFAPQTIVKVMKGNKRRPSPQI